MIAHHHEFKGGGRMKESQFEAYLESLESITSKDKAVRSRLSKGRKIERELRVDLDVVVADDYQTYQTLLRIQRELGDKNGAECPEKVIYIHS